MFSMKKFGVAVAILSLIANAAAACAGLLFAATLPFAGNYYLSDALSRGGSPDFVSTAGAVAACDSFLNQYQYKQYAYCNEVREMRTAFREMGDLLSKNHYTYEAFKSEARYLSQQMAGSPYRVVRDTWARLLVEEDSCRLRAALTGLTDYDFKVYLHDYAQQVCQDRYGHGLFSLQMNDMKLVRISQPTMVDSTAAVTCTAEYDVHLDGPLGLGLRTRTDHLTVSGELGYTSEGRLIFHRGSASAQ